MVRASTREESHPPVVDATPEIAEAAAAYEEACLAAEVAGKTYGAFSPQESRAEEVRWRARQALEVAVPTLPVAWHKVGNRVYGWRKRHMRGGLELVEEPAEGHERNSAERTVITKGPVS